MGIINHDPYGLPNGLNLTDTYLNMANTNVIIVNKDSFYEITYNYNIYVNQDARNNNQNVIQINGNKVIVSSLPVDIYTYCYNDLKSNYSNYSDC